MRISFDDYITMDNKDLFKQYLDKAKAADKTLVSRSGKGADFLGWLDLPNEISTEEIDKIQFYADKIKKESDVLIVVGIGGSYLGSRAAIEALGDSFNKCGTEVIFAGNNISGRYIESLLTYIQDKDYSINVISKSGTTTEPAIAFRILKQALEAKYKDLAKDRIYVTTDESKGALRSMVNEEDYVSFVIPDDVGGRYSVLTACGLLPIAVAGIDIQQMIEGAKYAKENLLDAACEYAAARNMLYSLGKTIEINVNYDPSMHYFTEWWKQLYGESEGKDLKGIFPAGVNNTADLHSMGQYIQEGLRNLFETVIYINDDKSTITVPKFDEDFDGLAYIEGKSLQYVNKQAMLGTSIAHKNGQVPVILIELDNMDSFNYGALVYFFERACGISGYVLDVNPFDQPGVEAYKSNMFKLLGKPGF